MLLALLTACAGPAVATPPTSGSERAAARPTLERPVELVGVYTDGAPDSPDDAATHDQSRRWLWMRTDGTYLFSEPGWSIEAGRWDADDARVHLEPEEVAHGTGGGVIDDQILGVSCHRVRVARRSLRRLRREPGGGLRGAHVAYVRWREDELLSLKNVWRLCTR